ncbi:hypothetical protein ACJX0J_034177 [Zea mays]
MQFGKMIYYLAKIKMVTSKIFAIFFRMYSPMLADGPIFFLETKFIKLVVVMFEEFLVSKRMCAKCELNIFIYKSVSMFIIILIRKTHEVIHTRHYYVWIRVTDNPATMYTFVHILFLFERGKERMEEEALSDTQYNLSGAQDSK